MYIIDYIIGLGASVMMPIIFMLLGLLLRLPLSKAIKAGLMVGIGFIGLSITVNLMIDSLTPVSHALVNRFGLNLNVLDVGWPAAAAVAMGTRVGALVIPVCVAINLLMLYTKTTRILNVDIWNLWHHAFTGSLVTIITDSLWLGVFAAGINCIITMVIADRTTADVEKYLNLPSISVPHGFSVSFVPAAWLVNAIVDRIPYIRDIKIDTEVIQQRLSILGDPASLGAIIGALLAIIAGIDLKAILQTAITMAAVMTIIPRMAKMLMEGVYPISERIQELAQSRAGTFGRIAIGLDSAVSVGHPVTLSVSMLMIPVMLVLAAVIPGNQFLPFASLTGLPFAFVLVTAVCRGDMFRTLLTALLTLSLALLIGTSLAPIVTSTAVSTGFSLPQGTTSISSVDYAGAMLPWAIIQGFHFKEVGMGILCLCTLGLVLWNRGKLAQENARNLEGEA
ncbi:PTS sugar transporter subunit IIC [Pluralibacter gergoviae]|uniref:PTS galactitol transporter subunit IIC n=1 Tax=Pluralibacter gergoviae TaxID=61647 RepID=UPI00190C02A2|nr:PTS transporter subunit IIC [Pluralibacter gergoviae]EKT9639007.1 PTS sugar transporter subunit IIC [Pluralibacter gergoviae]EKW9974432.1 PTS sugar transporter subunit IIC [Pluralibacter gergoviae]ELC3071764.1 PTS sugar transporter subunit IIC [Pluralibacter gergoviae]EMD1654903.1 PTS sugar transporter subunit IIC [Pluralibacter gergoviae]MBK4116248.1 PTS sugar transporter subunit IIC [Pluralibacter gergoviae]